MQKDFTALMAVTKDRTLRHCTALPAIHLESGRFREENSKDGRGGFCRAVQRLRREKNCTLIRYDIIQGLKNLYDEVKDETIKERALELIETEEDLKYRKKYASVWK